MADNYIHEQKRQKREMVISDGAGHAYCGKVEKNGCQTKKLSVKEAYYFLRKSYILFADLFVIFSFLAALSCASNLGHLDQYKITEIGLKNVVEIGMSIDEFAEKRIPYVKTPPPYQIPNTSFYRADQLGIEFETLDRQIIRIWFFSEKNSSYKLFMPKEGQTKSLSNICAIDIIQNFGKVDKYENRYPPKESHEAVWAKYHSFGMPTNTIDYPGMPFHFGLNWDDTLSYIAVSKIK